MSPEVRRRKLLLGLPQQAHTGLCKELAFLLLVLTEQGKELFKLYVHKQLVLYPSVHQIGQHVMNTNIRDVPFDQLLRPSRSARQEMASFAVRTPEPMSS